MHQTKARYLQANDEYRRIYRQALEAWHEWDKTHPGATDEQRLLARFEMEHELGLTTARTRLAEAEQALLDAFAETIRTTPAYRRLPERATIEELLKERPVWAMERLVRLALDYLP